MSADTIESTELTTIEFGTDLSKRKQNDALIAGLAERYGALVCNGPEDKAAFDAVHDAEQVMVKLRTGTIKAAKALTDPLKEQVKSIDKERDRLIAAMAPTEQRLKIEKQAVKDEIARREQEKADELYDLRKRRWLEATGNPPDFDGAFPEAFLRALSESEFEAEIQRLTEKTRREREELIRKAEQEAAEAKARADEAARLAEENRKLAAERERMDLERRQLAAEREKIEQERRESQAKIDAETARLASEWRAREESESSFSVGGMASEMGEQFDVPTAAAPSLPRSVESPGDFHLAFDDEGYGVLKFRLMEFSIGRSEGEGAIGRLGEGETELWLQIVDTLNKHFLRE